MAYDNNSTDDSIHERPALLYDNDNSNEFPDLCQSQTPVSEVVEEEVPEIIEVRQ